MTKQYRIRDQIRRNAVALISLVIAVSGLTYSTWRNEASEYNQNQRQASFELLLKLGELQQVVWHLHYDGESEERGNARTGWALVFTIRDLATVLEDPMPGTADRLFHTWDDNWTLLGERVDGKRIDDGIELIDAAIDDVRQNTQALLASLD